MFDDLPSHQRRKISGLYGLLIVANIGAWAWAIAQFGRNPVLIGTAFLAYALGLRHAVDADHIAAIDNVVRKMMQERKRPLSVGFFFALGHSTVVVLATIAIAVSATALQSRFPELQKVGSLIGTGVSALFLFGIAAVNLVILGSVWRSFRSVQRGERIEPEHLDMLLTSGGVLARICRSLFNMITRSWQMYPLGFLFGLGFDTATEIGLLGISATQVANGMPLWTMLIFPVLFACGMALVDTTDGVLMVGAYGWAFAHPIRKLWYNLTITAISVVVAFLVGTIEALALLADKFNLDGGVWGLIRGANDALSAMGFLVIGVFVLCWIVSALIYRWKRYDEWVPNSL